MQIYLQTALQIDLLSHETNQTLLLTFMPEQSFQLI